MINPMLPRRPMVVSNSDALVSLFLTILTTSDIHAVCVLSGNATVIRLKSKCQPNIIFISSRPTSANSFVIAAILSLGMGSDS